MRGSEDDLQAFHFDADSDLLARLLDACVGSDGLISPQRGGR